MKKIIFALLILAAPAIHAQSFATAEQPDETETGISALTVNADMLNGFTPLWQEVQQHFLKDEIFLCAYIDADSHAFNTKYCLLIDNQQLVLKKDHFEHENVYRDSNGAISSISRSGKRLCTTIKAEVETDFTNALFRMLLAANQTATIRGKRGGEGFSHMHYIISGTSSMPSTMIYQPTACSITQRMLNMLKTICDSLADHNPDALKALIPEMTAIAQDFSKFEMEKKGK